MEENYNEHDHFDPEEHNPSNEDWGGDDDTPGTDGTEDTDLPGTDDSTSSDDTSPTQGPKLSAGDGALSKDEQTIADRLKKPLESCDCRSECKYNTGYSYKYADYGYSR